MNIFTVLLTQPLANGLILFYKILGENLGIAIIVFSLFLRILMLPLTNPYMESMKKMKKYSKELEKLKEKHKGDRTKLMQSQADFYKQHGINPSAGCLPYILQIVVLLALFRLFTVVLSANGDTITKINGLLLLTVPFVWDEHEQPVDYSRYSSFGLKHLLSKHGLKIIENKKSEPTIAVIFQLINCYIYKKTKTKSLYLNLLFSVLLMAPFNILGLIFSFILPTNNDLYLDNIILAQKL